MCFETEGAPLTHAVRVACSNGTKKPDSTGARLCRDALRHLLVPRAVLWFRTSRPGVSGHAGLMCRVMADRLRSGMLRHAFYSVGIGRTHTRTRVIALIQDLDITIINVTTGEVLRPTRPRPHQALPIHRTTTRPHPQNRNG